MGIANADNVPVTTETEITLASGSQRAVVSPFGAVTIDEAEVRIPGTHYLEFGETLIPTGRLLPVQDSPWDCREFRRVGQTHFNHCYMRLQPDQDGSCRASLRNPKDWTNHRHRNGQGLYGPCRLYGRRDCEFAKAGIGHRTHDLLDGCLQPSRLGIASAVTRRDVHRPL